MAGHREIFVLSGGGSRGAGQVGMLRALWEAGIRPDVLVGGSVGAINACYLAAHPSAEGIAGLAGVWEGMSEEVLCGRRRRVVLNVARRRPYLFSSDRLRALVGSWVPVSRLEHLAVPTRIATTDIATGRAVHHDQGHLPDLVAASAALPAIFPPVVLPGADGPTTHIDAGVAENVPLSGALDLASPGDRVWLLDVTRTATGPRSLRNPIDVLVASLVASVRNREEPVVPAGVEVIRCKLDEDFDCGRVFDFTHTEELVRLGEDAVAAALAGSPTSDAGSGAAAALGELVA